ncbi:MAG: hypothetical protein E7011_02720 [Alphaproteobacteria bacterium]|nr:hypothetical protein [Alphaproteobacteria bacterium]
MLWHFFYPRVFHVVFLFITSGGIMQLTLIQNPDASASLAYQIARVVFAQTGATSLSLVEAMTSMIKNLSAKTNRSVSSIIRDKTIFDVLDTASPHHGRLTVPASSRQYQMCLRTAQRMLSGLLPDCCNGATMYHHANILPDWAIARGYIADIDGILFYL